MEDEFYFSIMVLCEDSELHSGKGTILYAVWEMS